jgi:very-short-patch-repair endonuclease
VRGTTADAFARHLRRNSTDAERRLWYRLRNYQIGQVKFRRQQPIGRYIADFVCFECGLIVELDGSQHVARTREDEERTAWLNSQGFRVMRFWNQLIFEEMDSVLEAIGLALEEPPHPHPPPPGEREPETAPRPDSGPLPPGGGGLG